MSVKKYASTHKDIVALVIVPALMMVLVAVFFVLPSIFKEPKYDFIYIDCQWDCYDNRPAVENGVLVMPQKSPYEYEYEYRNDLSYELYLHDVETNTSQEVSFDDALRYKLDDSYQSPDGYRFQKGKDGGVFFGGNYDYDSFYLVSSSSSKKLNLKGAPGYDAFLGWVIEDE